jgi:hypothetical protein
LRSAMRVREKFAHGITIPFRHQVQRFADQCRDLLFIQPEIQHPSAGNIFSL